MKRRTSNKSKVVALAKSHGATIYEESGGAEYVIYFDLPEGKIWNSSGYDSEGGAQQFDETMPQFWGAMLNYLEEGVSDGVSPE